MSEIVAPTDEAELCEAVRAARAAKMPAEIVGGGTRGELGRPVQAQQRLSTQNLDEIRLYEPGALTLVVGAGTRLSTIEALLEAEGQHLAFEPMDHRALYRSEGEPTIGAVTACNISGPRRVQTGACRDFVLGLRVVTGAGSAIKSGGRVMKNVTGYDLGRLICGAHGTLGIITEVAFKVLPKPEVAATLVIEGLADSSAIEALSLALGSPHGVTGAAHLPNSVDSASMTMIRLEGRERSVAEHVEKLKVRLAGCGDIAVEADPNRNVVSWSSIRDAKHLAEGEGAVWRISTKPTHGPILVERISARIELLGAFYDWGGGLVWLKTPDRGGAGARVIREALTSFGGHATLIRASAVTRAAVPVFQPEAEAVATLSRLLREKFDPAGILNPGRMAG